MSPKVLVVGGANRDYIVQVPHLPVKGETVSGGMFHTTRGGKGANQAVTAARLGAEVILVSRIGSDRLDDETIEAFRQEGIRTDYIVRDAHKPSGTALIMVSRSGENMIALDPGANASLSPRDLEPVESALQGSDVLLVQLEIPMETAVAAIAMAARFHVRSILNPAPAKELPAELHGMVDILTPNEKEARILSGGGEASKEKLLFTLAQKTGARHIVMTCGDEGAWVLSNGQNTHVPAFPITPVDTTGCGDAFNGALAVALGRGEELLQAVIFANAAGALTATRMGTQPSLPNAKELEAFLASRG